MKHIVLVPAFTLALSAGYLSGRMLSVEQVSISVQPDSRQLIPVVHIEGVRNGLLHGNIVGNARVSVGSTIVTEPGIFALDAGTLLFNTIEVVIPDGMQFIASSRGKKYYPVFSSAGNRITPKNRLYFRTAKEAEAAGYSG